MKNLKIQETAEKLSIIKSELTAGLSTFEECFCKGSEYKGFKRDMFLPHKEGSRTGTAFLLFAFGESEIIPATFRLEEQSFNYTADFITSKLILEIGGIKKDDSVDDAIQVQNAELNEYSVPIWLCGIYSACVHNEEVKNAVRESKQCKEALDSILTAISAGYLQRVSSASSSSPSAYLTFWAVCSLILARKIYVGNQSRGDEISEALNKVADWAKSEMSRLIANHHAGLVAKFDVVECIAAACMSSRLNMELKGRVNDEVRQLATYCIKLVLETYFQHGSLKLSRPVFSDLRWNTVLCPTAESMFMILSSFRSRDLIQDLEEKHTASIWEAFDLSRRNRTSQGYIPDFEMTSGAEVRPSIFSVSSTIAFFKKYATLLDDTLDSLARKHLSISNKVEACHIDYPVESFKQAVLKKIVTAHTEKEYKNNRKFSIILHGPPGTSKTTIAKKIASDLGWPLKIITQSDFLREGMSRIDSEAEDIFSVCLHLKQVVILFDELEELILAREPSEKNGSSDRESRLLTTSMLPKIHELRDRERVIFIFATNRLTSLDNAATRLGRFDWVFGVGYPGHETLLTAVRNVLEKVSPPLEGTLKSTFLTGIESEIKNKTEDYPRGALMTYKDMEFVAESIIHYLHDNAATEEVTSDKVARRVGEMMSKISTRNQKSYDQFAQLVGSDRL